jgi:outer membrane protein OmpA-like peptidoglycan-associated protein
MNREWISISDMMSGLMLIFLFIAISFMVKVEAEKKDMRDVVTEYRDTKANLNEALFAEFEDDLQSWDAGITKQNSIVFNSPEVLFDVSQSKLQKSFKIILQDFFPRYIKILHSKEYKDTIQEVRVEGHTSDTWKKSSSPKEIYLKNMKLSQERAFEVLAFCYTLEENTTQTTKEWLKKHFRANGMAFAKMHDRKTARRVEFVVQMKSEERISEILEKK